MSTCCLHLGFLMVEHMISSHQVKGRALPYDRFFTLLFHVVDIDLSREGPHYFDTLDYSMLSRMRKGMSDVASGDDRAEA